ncbi:hypothetical protein Slala05_51720 [Streptomyces lavendulae subsp. lavendulae]|nr:hypothetical protein Slala05_51720 [Streptomyces lavendulae subsp. lavendulae]
MFESRLLGPSRHVLLGVADSGSRPGPLPKTRLTGPHFTVLPTPSQCLQGHRHVYAWP